MGARRRKGLRKRKGDCDRCDGRLHARRCTAMMYLLRAPARLQQGHMAFVLGLIDACLCGDQIVLCVQLWVCCAPAQGGRALARPRSAAWIGNGIDCSGPAESECSSLTSRKWRTWARRVQRRTFRTWGACAEFHLVSDADGCKQLK